MTDLTAAGCGCGGHLSINNAGQIAGSSDPGLPQAVVWDPVHGTTDLGVLPGGFVSFSAAINNAGVVVGESNTGSFSVFHAFVWDPVRGMRDLGQLGSSKLDSSATGIDDSGGKVIGFSGSTHGVLWSLPTTPPSLSVSSASIVEGDSGKSRRLRFSVTMSEPSTTPVSVDYAVVGHGSAAEDSDFIAASGTVNFVVRPGTGLTTTTRFVSARIVPDVEIEGDETFDVILSNPTGHFGLGQAIGTGTILDDDPSGPLSVGIGDASGWEGHLGSANTISVPVTLSQPAPSTVSVQVTVTSPDATWGVDYKGAARTLTFNPGQYSKSVSIKLLPDLLVEGPEHVSIQLSNPTGGLSIGRSAGSVTILDDD
jgi:probable HAF family extracellular repeat protein